MPVALVLEDAARVEWVAVRVTVGAITAAATAAGVVAILLLLLLLRVPVALVPIVVLSRVA